jgi:hypothetical protein
MPDQTVEIKLVLRDELSKQLAPIVAQVRQLNQAIDTTRPQQHMERFGGAVQGVRRELSALSQITFGGLIGGGIVAGLMATAKALGDMANRGLQLRYSADALGVTTGMLNQFSDAMMGLGKSREAGQASIEAATKSLRELQIEGGQSKLFTELERAGGETGQRLAQELAKEIAGPRGLQGGLEYAMRRMAGMRQESAAKFAEILGLGPGFGREAARDYLQVLGQLPKRLELSHQQQLELAKANASLGISWDNIKTTLAGSLLPIFAQLTHTLDQFLQSKAGQEFTKQLESWGREMNAALKEWLEGGGLTRLTETLGTAVGTLRQGFEAADKVVTAMGTDWGHVLGALGIAVFASQLAGIASSLRLIGGIPGIALILGSLALITKPKIEDIKDPAKRAQAEKDVAGGAAQPGDPWALWNILKDLLKGNIDWKSMLREDPLLPFPGSGQSKTPSEKRADDAAKKNAQQRITEEFRDLDYELQKLNQYLAPGGPEGSAGSSGFQLPPYQQKDFTFYYPGASGAKGMEGPFETARAGLDKQFTPKTLDDFRLGLTPAVTVAGPASKLGQSINLGDIEYRSPIDGKVYQVPNVPGYVHDRGGAFTEDKPNKRDIAVGDFRGLNPVTGLPFNDATAEAFSRGNKQFAAGTFPTASGYDEAGFTGEGVVGTDPITSHLATRDSQSVNGTATVDIDVGGMTQAMRNPNDLFKPQPLGGSVQMQNVTRPDNNPMSFQ